MSKFKDYVENEVDSAMAIISELNRFLKKFCSDCINLEINQSCCVVEDALACMKEQKKVGVWG